MTPVAPCDTVPLCRPLARELVGIWGELSADQWLRPTVAGAWRVRDLRGELGGRGAVRELAGPRARVHRALADDVWRMFYNALAGDALRRRVTVAGDADLAAPLLRARSVMV